MIYYIIGSPIKFFAGNFQVPWIDPGQVGFFPAEMVEPKVARWAEITALVGFLGRLAEGVKKLWAPRPSAGTPQF